MNQPLKQLREKMAEHNVDAVIIPTSDFHDTEYVCDYFGARKHFSGFTGSAGVLVVLKDQAGLWTDGRYFLQAAQELKDSGVDLMKMGMPETPSIEQYILDHVDNGGTLAFDGRCISMHAFEKYQDRMNEKNIRIETSLDLAGEAWPDRPELPATETFHFDEKYTGKSMEEKLSELREAMNKAGARHHVTNKIDEVAWLYNLRAHDIPSFPVALAYTIVDEDGGTLYIDESRLDATSAQLLKKAGIRTAPYDQVYDDAKALEGQVLMDRDFINSRIGRSIENPIWQDNPIQLMKACKNETEVNGFREAHKQDAVAMIRFWKWLEDEMKAGHVLTETSAADQLHEFRSAQPDFIEESFTTISAYGANASMPHYHPDHEHPVVIENRGLYLVDSGGHYYPGTTDITRTFVVGDLTDEEKEAFTRVLQGHIALEKAVFPAGARGLNLDITAREPLWKNGLDFNHGTGHGVGHVLSVHEGPNGFRWRIVPERKDSCVLMPGMVTSDEPGLYVEGKYGIRHENLLVTVPAFETEFGQFYRHDALTLVPFDVRGLNVKEMEQNEIDWLNAYHQRVYDEISPRLNEEEAAWLYEKTRPIHA